MRRSEQLVLCLVLCQANGFITPPCPSCRRPRLRPTVSAAVMSSSLERSGVLLASISAPLQPLHLLRRVTVGNLLLGALAVVLLAGVIQNLFRQTGLRATSLAALQQEFATRQASLTKEYQRRRAAISQSDAAPVMVPRHPPLPSPPRPPQPPPQPLPLPERTSRAQRPETSTTASRGVDYYKYRPSVNGRWADDFMGRRPLPPPRWEQPKQTLGQSLSERARRLSLAERAGRLRNATFACEADE